MGDYINASYVQGFSHARKFIATQAPLDHTIADFWRMIVEQRVRVIIMLTNLNERHYRSNEAKCARYWPSKHSHLQQHTYDRVCVTRVISAKQERRDYFVRQFTVSDLDNVNQEFLGLFY